MMIKNIRAYFRAWQLYFMLLKVHKWRSDDPLKQALIEALQATNVWAYNQAKIKFNRALPPNPMKKLK